MFRVTIPIGIALAVMVLAGCQTATTYQWGVHDMNRPQPPVVMPGAEAHLPPSDATVLFDGTDLSAWRNTKDGGLAEWKVMDGFMEVVPDTGAIMTRQAFGSCQLHLEWATPEAVVGQGQMRGNSGVFLMGRYEVQILDSFENATYPDGQAAAIYGQNPPLVNASRGPGQWQSYDLIFKRPVFNEKGKLLSPATITVLHNGVLVQNHWVIEGITYHKKRAAYELHGDKEPILLQDHGNPMRFRNVWIRPLND